MDKDILSKAIGEMRGDMRKRVGKKLLTIQILGPDDQEDAIESDSDIMPDKKEERGSLA